MKIRCDLNWCFKFIMLLVLFLCASVLFLLLAYVKNMWRIFFLFFISCMFFIILIDPWSDNFPVWFSEGCLHLSFLIHCKYCYADFACIRYKYICISCWFGVFWMPFIFFTHKGYVGLPQRHTTALCSWLLH